MLSIEINIVIIAAILMFAVLSMYCIRYGLYLVVFSMPFYLVRFSLFGIPTTFLEAMIYILFFAWLLREIAKEKRFKELFILFKNEKCLSCGIALLFWGLFVSTAYSSDVITSLGIVKGWFLDPLLVFLVFISCIKLEKEITNVLLSWALSGLVVALIAISYFMVGELTFDGRLKAFFLSPNHLAMYLAPVLLIFIYSVMQKHRFFKNNSINKGFLISGTILTFTPIILSRSYGAFFAVLVSSAGFLYFKKNNIALKAHNKRKRILFSAIIIVMVIFASSSKLIQIYDSNERSSLHSRIMIWNASWEIIKESPIIGIGPGTFQEKYLSISGKFKEPYLEWAVPQPHNVFLAFYIQTGLVGFIGFLFLLCWIFGKDKKNDISKLIMIYILLHGFIDTTYWKNDLAIMFWLALGIAGSMKLNMTEKGPNKRFI